MTLEPNPDPKGTFRMSVRGIVLAMIIVAFLVAYFGFGIGQGRDPSVPGANC